MAIGQRRLSSDIGNHSDQGSQYTSLAFGKRCQEAGVRPPMGSVGDAYDKAMCVSFFATLECELLERRRFVPRPKQRWRASASSKAGTTRSGCTPRWPTGRPWLTKPLWRPSPRNRNHQNSTTLHQGGSTSPGRSGRRMTPRGIRFGAEPTQLSSHKVPSPGRGDGEAGSAAVAGGNSETKPGRLLHHSLRQHERAVSRRPRTEARNRRLGPLRSLTTRGHYRSKEPKVHCRSLWLG